MLSALWFPSERSWCHIQECFVERGLSYCLGRDARLRHSALSLSQQGVSLEFLRGVAPSGSDVDVCSSSHDRQTLHIVPNTFCRV